MIREMKHRDISKEFRIEWRGFSWYTVEHKESIDPTNAIFTVAGNWQRF